MKLFAFQCPKFTKTVDLKLECIFLVLFVFFLSPRNDVFLCLRAELVPRGRSRFVVRNAQRSGWRTRPVLVATMHLFAT